MLLERVKGLIHRRRLERDLDDELAFHLAMRAEKDGAAGARRRFGNVTHIRETCRDLWTFGALETLGQDLRYAVRTLRAAPSFTAVAILSLALGLGANTALFSLMDVMLLRTLPVRNPGELVEFVRAHPDGAHMTNLPQQVYDYFLRDSSALSEVFAVSPTTDVFRGAGAPERTRAHEVSGSYFPTLGVQPLLGRTITPEDDRTGAATRVAVLSYGFWSRQFGRDASAMGATVRIGNQPFTVIGVMPPEFVGIDRLAVPDLWLPMATDVRPHEAWVLGRLRPSVSVEQARASLEPLFREALESMRPQFAQATERERNGFMAQRLLVNRAAEGTSNIRWTYWTRLSTLKILLALTGLVLLIACANLANLLVARSAGRAREIGIRLALGAGRWRVARQLMTENLLLALAGGALGLVAAGWGHRALLTFLVRNPLNSALDYRLDLRVVGFGLALSALTAVAFGLAPAIRSTRLGGAARLPAGKPVLAVQISLSMVLLVGAGLFARSLRNLVAADLGIARENLLLIDVRASSRTPDAAGRFWFELSRRLEAQPGVRSVALAGDAVFGNGGWAQTVWIDRPGQTPQDATVAENLVSAGFFATAGIPLIQGREFGEQDREGAPLVVLVNQTFARRFFGGGNAVGRRFGDRGAASSGRYEIVGVVGDAKYGAVRDRVPAMVFHPMRQEQPRRSCVLHVRTAAPPESLIGPIRREILAVDSGALLHDPRTLPQILRTQLREDRMFAALAAFFALVALALGAIGIYGVLAYRVARRTAEIGVRIALGASRRNVLWLIMRDVLVLLGAGGAIGGAAALAAARAIRGLLYGVETADVAVSLTTAVAVLIAAGMVAGYLPARRGASIEPSDALRAE